jgi:hypothetical protein
LIKAKAPLCPPYPSPVVAATTTTTATITTTNNNNNNDDDDDDKNNNLDSFLVRKSERNCNNSPFFAALKERLIPGRLTPRLARGFD